MESLFLHADSPQQCGLGVSTLSVHLPCRFLHILLRLIPVLHPAPVELRRGPVAFGRTAHGAIALGNVACLFSQLIFVNEAALLFAGFFGVRPRLFLPRCKDAIKHNTPIMHEGSNEEDVLPLFSGLETEKRVSHSLILFCLTRFSAAIHVLVFALLLVQCFIIPRAAGGECRLTGTPLSKKQTPTVPKISPLCSCYSYPHMGTWRLHESVPSTQAVCPTLIGSTCFLLTCPSSLSTSWCFQPLAQHVSPKGYISYWMGFSLIDLIETYLVIKPCPYISLHCAKAKDVPTALYKYLNNNTKYLFCSSFTVLLRI